MAIIKRSQVSVFGLPEALVALQQADSAEAAARILSDANLSSDVVAELERALAAELILRNNLATEVSDRSAAITAEADSRIASDTTLQTQINNLLANVDGVALNSLAEIVTAFQEADSTLNGAITALSNAAGAGLTTEVARAEAAELVLRSDLATEVAARAAADTLLDSSLRAFTTEAVRVGGAIPKMEAVVVTANKIVLSFAPKAGVNGIMNFGRVSYVDENNVENLAPVSVDGTDATGKTFIVAVDVSGQWDTKSVSVQYMYIAV